MNGKMILEDRGTSIGARDAEPTIEPPIWVEVPDMMPWDVMESSAIHTRDDVSPVVKADTWATFQMLGQFVPSYEDLEATAARHAKLGIDPRESVLPTGLLLSDHGYAKLEAFVRGTEVAVRRRKRRRVAS